MCVCVAVQKVSGAAVLRSHQVPYDVRRTLDRALPGVYFLIKASVLRCWAVALDIKASVHCLGIYVFFFTNVSDALFPVIYRMPWNMRPCQFIMHSTCC